MGYVLKTDFLKDAPKHRSNGAMAGAPKGVTVHNGTTKGTNDSHCDFSALCVLPRLDCAIVFSAVGWNYALQTIAEFRHNVDGMDADLTA